MIEVPDHQIRKTYHDKLGRLLDIEADKPSVAVQVNNNTITDDQLNRIIT